VSEAVVVAPMPISVSEAQTSSRRHKARQRRNVWRDQAGTSLFEIDEGQTSQVKLVGNEGVNLPFSALPSKAKFVVRQYQYQKRDNETRQDFESSGDEDEYEDDEELDQYMYSRQPGALQATLVEFLGNSPAYTQSWLILAQESLLALRTASIDAVTGLQNCKIIRENIMKAIETDSSISEELMIRLFAQLEELNVVL